MVEKHGLIFFKKPGVNIIRLSLSYIHRSSFSIYTNKIYNNEEINHFMLPSVNSLIQWE